MRTERNCRTLQRYRATARRTGQRRRRTESPVDEGFGGNGTILRRMGFNPYRKFVAKPADYVFVIAAAVAVIGLLAWAFLG
jgi:hypothetical protein